MARSMTGFGRGSSSAQNISMGIEVKTVNHKHLNVHLNNSRSYPELESQIRTQVQKTFERGSVHVTLTIERPGSKQGVVALDEELAKSYHGALTRLEAALGETPTPKLNLISSLPGVLTLQEPNLDLGLLQALLEEALAKALASVQDLRTREGATLSGELRERIQTLRQQVAQVEPLGRESLAHHRLKLGERVKELVSGAGVTVQEDRLELEIALLADRCDVSEEIERLRSHLDQFARLLDQSVSVGRQLDFLCQEIARELNTIGSKSQDARLAQLVVEMRSENERIREQVQNLE